MVRSVRQSKKMDSFGMKYGSGSRPGSSGSRKNKEKNMQSAEAVKIKPRHMKNKPMYKK